MVFFLVASHADSLKNFRGEFLKILLARDYSVHVAAPNIELQFKIWLQHLGCTVHSVKMERTGLNPVKDLFCLWQLQRILKDIQPDVFIGYTIKPVIYGNLAAWVAGVKIRCALITGLGFAFTSKVTGIKRLIVVFAKGLYKVALSKATHVLFQNPDDLALFKELKLVAGDKCGIVNGSGVDLNHYPVKPLLNQPVFLYIGRLLTDKGIVEYAEAARKVKARFPEARFLVAGWIDTNPAAISQAQLDEWVTSGVIEFLGKLDDVRPAIEQCSVYVLPSYREGTPRTVLEAMSMGRPVITTDAPGCRETVVDGRNGYLVPVKAIDPLADAMIRLLEDPQRREEMGREGRLLAEDKYDVHKVNRAILEFLGINKTVSRSPKSVTRKRKGKSKT